MKEQFDRTWRFLQEVDSRHSAAEVEACLLELAASFGFTTIFGGIVPTRPAPPAEIASRILFQRLPAEWAKRYTDNGYAFLDPVVHRLHRDRMPFGWDEAYNSCPKTKDVALIKGEAAEFGLREGYVVPISMLEGGIAAVSFGGQSLNVGVEARSILNFAASYAVGSRLRQAACRRCRNQSPTPRECDCLLWAAEGKTDWEISVILGISRSTVIKHIAAAREKLGAVNKAHAIAMAMRAKLLR